MSEPGERWPAELWSSPRAELRRARALAWLRKRGAAERLLVIGASAEAARELVRDASTAQDQLYDHEPQHDRDRQHDHAREQAHKHRAGFGWHRLSFAQLTSTLAARALAQGGLAPIGGASLEALCARLLHEEVAQGRAGELAAIASLPGTARAVAHSLAELRLNAIAPERVRPLRPGLAQLALAYESALTAHHLADRAQLLQLAIEEVRAGRAELCGLPFLLLDLPIASAREEALIAALGERAPGAACVPVGDGQALARLSRALRCTPRPLEPEGHGPLVRLQRHLFRQPPPRETGDTRSLEIFSAPGEGRECVEIARRVQEAAARGVPFDRMAVLLRQPGLYRPLLEEALARAEIPAWFAKGSLRPDPAGRAFLALLACAADGLSARRFAEYLSLGEVPAQTEPEILRTDWAPPAQGEELLGAAIERRAVQSELAAAQSEQAAGRGEQATGQSELATGQGADGARSGDHGVAAGEGEGAAGLRASWRWEPLLLEAAVIGGHEVRDAQERWRRRLTGFRAELSRRLEALAAEDEPGAARARKQRDDLDALWAFAEPLLAALASLPARGSWSDWVVPLTALARQSLRHPERVQGLLAELWPLGPIGPITLDEVQLALSRRLTELAAPPPVRRDGKLFVGPIEAARGLSFLHVFVPGLAERLFPAKALQDPLLRDRERARLDPSLATEEQRVLAERLQLHLAVGAAEQSLALSWPRLELQGGRARVPSFYGVEALAAAEGHAPSFAELSRRGEQAAQAKASWPAPLRPGDAIDAAEHDLALLGDALRRSDDESRGVGRYLLGANDALRRAIYRAAQRPRRRWYPADGLVTSVPEARAGLEALAALGPQQLGARSFSASALQQYAACPYKFFLYAILRLAPREEPRAIDALEPLARGTLMHQVQFELLQQLAAEGALPLHHEEPARAAERLAHARARLEQTLDKVASESRDALAPAIDRVWRDSIASIRADLREWLGRMANEPLWSPHRFELSFGLPDRGERDEHSRAEALQLPIGLKLRGSIDLVEQTPDGALRATDYKSGKARAKEGVVIGGGAVLQPLLYALALEAAFPEARVEGGRLWYCTFAGDFTTVDVRLDAGAREAIATLVRTLGEALRTGFFPASPRAGECTYCDFFDVCGPGEEQRAARKPQLVALDSLRSQP